MPRLIFLHFLPPLRNRLRLRLDHRPKRLPIVPGVAAGIVPTAGTDPPVGALNEKRAAVAMLARIPRAMFKLPAPSALIGIGSGHRRQFAGVAGKKRIQPRE